MADNTSQGPKGTQSPETTAVPLRLVRGHASPEELGALVAILAAVSGDDGPDPSEPPPSSHWRYPQSPWSSPRRMVRTTHPHGPGGWRASALSR